MILQNFFKGYFPFLLSSQNSGKTFYKTKVI